MRRAFIVVGPESSGTKFVTNLFVKAGCYGDGWHEQRLDSQDPPMDAEAIVFRRSYPHAEAWPNLTRIVERFDGLNYDVRVIVVIRSLPFTLASRRQHAKGNLHKRATKALQLIGLQWAQTGRPGVWVTYESLVQYPKHTMQWLFAWCGLDAPDGVNVRDGNAKYVDDAT